MNPILYERVCENIFKDDQTKPNLNGKKGAKITGFNLHELGIKEIPVKIITSEVPEDLMAATEDYIPTEVEGYPPRAREYERIKNEN